MDPYTRWVLTSTTVLLLPASPFLGPGLWLLTRWLRKRSRVSSLVGSLPLILVGAAWVWLVVSPIDIVFNRLTLARELGLPPPTDLVELDPAYPEAALLARISPGVSTREDVHQVMTLARVRYDCPKYRVEKYLLYQDRYEVDLPSGNVPDGVNIYYRADGVVDKLWSFGDSIDPVLIEECSPTPIPTREQ